MDIKDRLSLAAKLLLETQSELDKAPGAKERVLEAMTLIDESIARFDTEQRRRDCEYRASLRDVESATIGQQSETITEQRVLLKRIGECLDDLRTTVNKFVAPHIPFASLAELIAHYQDRLPVPPPRECSQPSPPSPWWGRLWKRLSSQEVAP